MHILETPLAWLLFQISPCQKATLIVFRVGIYMNNGSSNASVIKTKIREKYILHSLDK